MGKKLKFPQRCFMSEPGYLKDDPPAPYLRPKRPDQSSTGGRERTAEKNPMFGCRHGNCEYGAAVPPAPLKQRNIKISRRNRANSLPSQERDEQGEEEKRPQGLPGGVRAQSIKAGGVPPAGGRGFFRPNLFYGWVPGGGGGGGALK
jgi:hypothetical protein